MRAPTPSKSTRGWTARCIGTLLMSAAQCDGTGRTIRAHTPSTRGWTARGIGTLLMSGSARDGIGLSSTPWVVTLDIGREVSTWMPPRWCTSGTRVSLPLMVSFGDGRAACTQVGPYFDDIKFDDGDYSVSGAWPNSVVRFSLLCTSGYQRGDNALPAGERIYFAQAFLGGEPSKRPGTLSVIQRRFILRKERRLVGTLSMEPWREGALPPARVYFDKRNVF
jgi:hypothetical protein